MAESIIQAKGITRKFRMGEDIVCALDDVDISIEAGEFIAIVGPSGSGKSTFLHLIAGLDDTSTGVIIVDGEDISSLSERGRAAFRNSKIGFVFQDFNLMGHKTARENVEMPLMFANVSRPERRTRALEALKSVGIDHRARHLPGELSGGERQRVAIARAMVTNPLILLADEPTGNMDSTTGGQVIKLLKKLCIDKNITVVVVTHNEKVSAAADRVFTIIDGKLKGDAS